MTRAQVTVLVALVFGAWWFWMVVAGNSIGIEQFSPFSFAVTILLFAVTAFNEHLWRWPLFRNFLSNRPVLAGLWKVEIKSTFFDEQTGKGKLIEGYYLIRQNYSGLSIRFFTRETTSKTQSAQLVKTEDGKWALEGTYLDTPAASYQGGSPMHFGAFSLLLAAHPVVKTFEGRYWTSRQTQGVVRSLARVAATGEAASEISGYELAESLFIKLSKKRWFNC